MRFQGCERSTVGWREPYEPHRMSYERSRWWLFSALAFPVISVLLAAPWMFARPTFNPDTSSYGILPWLVIEWKTQTWEFKPLEAIVASLLTIGVAVCSRWVLRTIVRFADLQGKCQNCGYPMVVPSSQCPECGRPHPDPIVERRRTRLGKAHRLLIVSLILTSSVLGLTAWFLFIRIFQFASHAVSGIFAEKMLIVMIPSSIASAIIGASLFYRYVRTMSPKAAQGQR